MIRKLKFYNWYNGKFHPVDDYIREWIKRHNISSEAAIRYRYSKITGHDYLVFKTDRAYSLWLLTSSENAKYFFEEL